MAAAMEMTLDDLARFLDQRASQLTRIDLTKPMKVILLLAKSSIKENFAGSHAPDGTPWLPLKRPRQGKRHRNSTPLPLRDTGLLMASVTSAGPHHVERTDERSMQVGTNLEYAAIHNFGGTIHKPERARAKPWVFTNGQGQTIFTRKIKEHDVTIPARQFIGWGPKLIEQTADVLSEALEEKLS